MAGSDALAVLRVVGVRSGMDIRRLQVVVASTYFTSALPEVWLYALGGLFVVSTLYLPAGVVGLISKLTGKMKKA